MGRFAKANGCFLRIAAYKTRRSILHFGLILLKNSRLLALLF
jgi:hypothetical protein